MFAPENVEKVLCHLLRFGSSKSDAEDLAQEALLVAWRKRDQLDAERSLDAWLYGIARNVFRNHARRERRSPVTLAEPDDDTAVGAGAGASAAIPPVDLVALRRALDALPEPQQDVVILHQLQGYTVDETAGLLGIPFETAKDRLRRARTTLQERLGDELDGTMQRERHRTQQLARLAVAPVLAGVLGMMLRPELAAAAAASSVPAAARGVAGAAGGAAATTTGAKAYLAAALAVGIAVGVAGDRLLASAPRDEVASAAPAPTGSTAAVPAAAAAPTPVVTPAVAPAADADTPQRETAPPSPAPSPAPARYTSAGGDASSGPGVNPEAQVIERARTALARNRAGDALRALMSHERQFPRGQLAEERDLLVIEAYLARDDRRLARERAERFRAAYPASIHAARVDEVLRELAP